MIDYNFLFNLDSFQITKEKKANFFLKNLLMLSKYHYENSKEYKIITDNIFKKINSKNKISDLPFIHTSAFKNFNLTSIKEEKHISVFNSSGTSGKNRSKINLDTKTSILQSKALKKIFSNLINKSDDIFFIERENILSSNDAFTAKGAAIKGFGQLSNKKKFLLDKNHKLKLSILENYIKKNPKKRFIIFGFTSFVWKYLIDELKKRKIFLNKNNSILIHGGGWKKMNNLNVTNNIFKKYAKMHLGSSNVFNYYGMIEQTGSVFLECKKGFFHCSIFSDILIRNSDLNLCKKGEIGLVQTMSLLPLSYPGHNLLTEDLGRLEGVDNCKCGNKGKYFSIIGRVPDSELRGCSDVT